jgi:hypothetical protein
MSKKKRFKKGSAAARAFMAKIRNMRKGARRVSRKRKTLKRSFRSERVKPIIIEQESIMSRKRRKVSKRRHTVKAKRTYSGARRVSRKRRSIRRYSGFKIPKMGKMKPMAIITEVAGIGAGAIAGSFVAKLSQRVPFLANPKITPFIPIILGVLLPMTKIGRSAFAKDIASGSLAIGVIAALRQFAPQLPLLSGDEATEILGAIENMSPAEREMLGQGSMEEVLVGDENVLPAEALVGGL